MPSVLSVAGDATITDDFHEIEAEVRFLTSEEGGRNKGVASGYRGQFFYDGMDYDASHYYPMLPAEVFLELGVRVMTHIRIRKQMWDRKHANHVKVGMRFLIREGSKTVAEGVVTRV